MKTQPDRVGPWKIIERLGQPGGNADVWRAEHDDGRLVALKVLRTRRAESEPYKRFRQEISVVQGLGEFPGVLPVVDAHLPERPTSADPAWLAMPVATPLREALKSAPLEEVVSAIAQVASTLARLHERKIAHRDAKPSNLYQYAGRAAVGDFGLVAAPDQEELTGGKPLGPLTFRAYEMIADPAGADPFPADVYTIGKTLWSLCTGGDHPPLGHQRAGLRGYRVSDLRPHPEAAALDRVVDLATQHEAARRPTMAQLATDLAAWADLGRSKPKIDLSHLRVKVMRKLQTQLDAEDLAEQRRRLALEAVRRLHELSGPLNNALEQLHPKPQLDLMSDDMGRMVLKMLNYRSDFLFTYQRVSKVSTAPRPLPYSLAWARALALEHDGTLHFGSMVWVKRERVMGVDYNSQIPDRAAPVGTVEADRMIEDGIVDTVKALEEAARIFAEKAPSA